MKKLLHVTLFVLAMIVASTALFGCSGDNDQKTGNNTPNIAATDLYTAVSEVGGFGDMTAVPSRDVFEVYGINTDSVEDYVWYMSSNPSLNGDEAAFFYAKDAETAEALVETFEARLERQKTVAEAYSPLELAKLNMTEVTRYGNLVCYVVCSNYDSAISALEAKING